MGEVGCVPFLDLTSGTAIVVQGTPWRIEVMRLWRHDFEVSLELLQYDHCNIADLYDPRFWS